MQQITLNIPDDQFRFFMELISKLPFVKMENEEAPDWHQEIVIKRLNEHKNDPSSSLNWEIAKRDIEFE